VRRVAALENPVLRNLEITHSYAHLAAAFAERTGEGANWCTYAVWASRQAGRTIRGEDLLERLHVRLGARAHVLHPLRSLGRALLRRGLYQPGTRLGRLTARIHTPFDAFERASAAVARGNLKVFAEIGLEFARYLTDGLEPVLAKLREGEPPEGQAYLRRAFTHYERGLAEDDAKARSELLFLANVEIGLHEQARLQPEIRAALDAAVPPRHALFPRLVAAPLQRASTRLAREAITDCLMVLAFPGRVLALGAHLSDPYPEALREPADRELVELLARYEPPSGDLDDCGARDWSDLRQRMHYIVHLFRCFHAARELFDPPFTAEQVESFRRGRVPDGVL
jgi:hypothetical protein